MAQLKGQLTQFQAVAPFFIRLRKTPVRLQTVIFYRPFKPLGSMLCPKGHEVENPNQTALPDHPIRCGRIQVGQGISAY